VLPLEDSPRRRLLAVVIMDGNDLMGVLRLVRSETAKPYTRCDEHVLLEAATMCRPLIHGWREAQEPESDGDKRLEAARLRSVRRLQYSTSR
jgi:hypothetical protein